MGNASCRALQRASGSIIAQPNVYKRARRARARARAPTSTPILRVSRSFCRSKARTQMCTDMRASRYYSWPPTSGGGGAPRASKRARGHHRGAETKAPTAHGPKTPEGRHGAPPPLRPPTEQLVALDAHRRCPPGGRRTTCAHATPRGTPGVPGGGGLCTTCKHVRKNKKNPSACVRNVHEGPNRHLHTLTSNMNKGALA